MSKSVECVCPHCKREVIYFEIVGPNKEIMSGLVKIVAIKKSKGKKK